MDRAKCDNGYSISVQTDHFISMFNKKKNDIENNLLKAEQLDKDKLALHFDFVTEDFQKLQKYVADSTVFLPFYNLRVAQEALKKLQDLIFATQDKLLPKKKFTFRKKTAKSACNYDEPDKPRFKSNSVLKVLSYNHDSCGFRDQKNQNLELGETVNNKDVELSKLEECNVRILGTPSTLHINDLEKCNLFVGPVATSIFVENCNDCVFLVACQQLRVHSNRNCNFYLHVTSRAIVEDSVGLGFAPYDWSYEGMEAHYEISRLDRSKNNWNLVDDFNWLSADSHSPNWHIIEESQRECHK